jgi:hypothetical protein
MSMKKDSKENRGIKQLLNRYRDIFRTRENVNYYSIRDYQVAEKKFLKHALLNGIGLDSRGRK